jgi:tRNA(adenine34) deaminase
MLNMPADPRHERYMRLCIELARRALESHDTPVGSLVVRAGNIIAEGVEAVRGRGDVTAHAEIEAIRAATGRTGSLDLTGCTLYTTVEPCVMCAYALRLARVSAVVTGTRSTDTDTALSGCAVLADAQVLPGRTPPLLVRDVLATECRAVLMERRT